MVNTVLADPARLPEFPRRWPGSTTRPRQTASPRRCGATRISTTGNRSAQTHRSTEAVFKQFLNKLPKAGSGIPETHIGYFGNWIFDTANSGYPVPLAGCLPEDPKQTALVKFAEALMLPQIARGSRPCSAHSEKTGSPQH